MYLLGKKNGPGRYFHVVLNKCQRAEMIVFARAINRKVGAIEENIPLG
jgi:hypothetical protein